jgi:peptidoglycan/xylan/chitin deacetylase (PgdA/CDA1 family)
MARDPLVLCYHAASDSWQHQLAVPPRTLERQLRSLLRRGFRPATAAQTLSGGRRLVHVTFDDAYRSIARVLPALERLGLPATVFACAEFAQNGGPLDVAELRDDVRAHPDELATMGWEELRELSERGVEIGSHTLTHAHLTRLSDEELDRELRESRERVETELGRACRFFAYPYGEHDERIRAAVRAAGYEAAFGLPGRSRRGDRYALPRVDVYRKDGTARFLLKTTAPVHRAVSGLRRAVR